MNQYRLFASGPVREDFSFNAQVAEVFDDMLSRSVPCYAQVIDCMAAILRQKAMPGTTVYDLGCATGTTLLELARRLPELELVVEVNIHPVQQRIMTDHLFTEQQQAAWRQGRAQPPDKLRPGRGPDELQGVVAQDCTSTWQFSPGDIRLPEVDHSGLAEHFRLAPGLGHHGRGIVQADKA